MGAAEGIALLGVVVALGIAVVGWSKAKAADLHAAEAIGLARSADERADRLERLKVERRDVQWVQETWHDDHRRGLTFRNAGTDVAHDVELVVDPVDGQGEWPRRSTQQKRVEPAERLGIDMTQEHISHMTDHQNRRLTMPRPQLVRVRIVWRSELRAPGIQEFDRIQL